MKILVNEKISQHKFKTPEGYLVCVDSVLARTGKQTYRKNELFTDGDDSEIQIDRTPEEVFAPQTLASFENKPITLEHPDEDVNVDNYKDYAIGFVRDVKQGTFEGQPVILGTLVFTDAEAIKEIEDGTRTELSCGYDCDIEDDENPRQTNIRGNHVALCEAGRAGIAKIVDSAKTKDAVEPNAKGYYKGYEIVATTVEYKNAPTQVDIYEEGTKRKFKSYFTAETDLNKAIEDAKRIYMQEVPMTRKDRDRISNYLSMVSGFVRRKDTDIQDVIRPLQHKGFKPFVDKVEGWIWKKGNYAYKNYYIGLDGFTDQFLVTLYADPDQDWDTKEVNAYFLTDSVSDKNYGGAFDIDPESYFTREDLMEFEDELERKLGHNARTRAYVDRDMLSVDYEIEGESYSTPAEVKIDMRKIKRPNDLNRYYLEPIRKIIEKEYKDSVGDAETPDEEQTEGLEKELENYEKVEDAEIPNWFESLYYEACEKYGKKDYSSILRYVSRNTSLSQTDEKTLFKWLKQLQTQNEKSKDSMHDVDPREGESKEDFISRFMEETKSEYPDEKQRLAVAYSYWENKRRDSMKDALSYNDLFEKIKVGTKMKELRGHHAGQNFVVKKIRPSGGRLNFIIEYDDGQEYSAYSDDIWDDYKANKLVFADSIKDGNVRLTLKKKKNDYGEFKVVCMKNGKYDEEGTYYTDDWDDAVGTLKQMAKQMGLSVTQNGSSYVADSKTKDGWMNVHGKTAQGYEVRAMITNSDGRIYAVIYRPNVNDYLVAAGYNQQRGDWDQGYYDFKTEEQARKKAEQLVRKYNSYDSKKKDSIYSLKVNGEKSKKLVRAKDASEAIEKYKKMFPKHKVVAVEKAEKFNGVVENIPR